MAEGMSGRISQTSLFVLNLRQMNFKLLSVLIERVPFPYDFHSSYQQLMFHKPQFRVYLYCSCDFRFSEFPVCSVTVKSYFLWQRKLIP